MATKKMVMITAHEVVETLGQPSLRFCWTDPADNQVKRAHLLHQLLSSSTAMAVPPVLLVRGCDVCPQHCTIIH